MKTTSKLLCLIAVVGAIFVAMWLAHYIVTPPKQQVEKSNQYVADLSNCIDTLKNAPTEQQDNLFLKYLSRIRIFGQEERIDTPAIYDFYRRLLDLYAPRFTKECFSKFSNNMWYKSDHVNMLNIISKLKGVQYSNGRQVLSKEHIDSLNSIKKIINDYKDAWDIVSNKTTFNGSVDDARGTIDKANNYAQDRWLNHCTALCQALENVKPAIATSHYDYLKREVDGFEKFPPSISYDSFKKENNKVEKDLKGYEDLYGSDTKIKALRQRKNDAYIKGYNFYFPDTN